MQLLLKQKQQLPNRHHFQSSSQPQSPQRTSSLTPGFQFHLWNSSKPHQLHQYSLGFTYALTYTILNACLLTVTIIENQRAEEKKIFAGWFLSHYLFFDGQLTLGMRVYGEGGGGGGGVCLCLPVRAPGPPALFCCDACVLSLAWLESLHLMVYSYSAVQDAVPWGFLSHSICLRRSNRKEVWVPVSVYGHLKCFALVLRLEQRSFSKSTNTTDFLYFSPERQMFYSRHSLVSLILFFTCLFDPFIYYSSLVSSLSA